MNSINLLNNKLVNKVISSCPQRDGYELENLIENSDNTNGFNFFSNSKNNGFVSDTFIRPPITIEIIFNEPVNIEKIVLDAKVNAQVSNGFIISSSFESLTTLKNDSNKFKTTYSQIAKIINDKNKSVHIYEFLKRDKDLPNTSGLNRVYFSSKSPYNLAKVTALSICIIKTLNSSTPCLRTIKVYGSLLNKSSAKIETGDVEMLVKKVKIPDEFIDELTHEMMRMPVRLPSKKLIDQSTLDKYLAEKKKNNEIIKDPFTCVEFSTSYKPILDEELKSRIDKFLFEYREYILEYKADESQSIIKRSDSKRKIQVENTSNTKRTRHQSSVIKCNSCFNVKTENKIFYEIETCKHVFCRFCVTSIKNKCSSCGKEFNNNQIVNMDRNYLK